MILTPKEKEEKRTYVEEYLLGTFLFDDRSDVLDMRYEVVDMPDRAEETVKVFFKGGGLRKVNVTSDKFADMYKDIGKAVYG